MKLNPHRLNKIRLRSGLSIRTLAERLGVSAPVIVDLEKGRRNPSYELLSKLEQLTGVDKDWFFEWDEDELDSNEEALLAAGVARRVKEALAMLPHGGAALPIMLGTTAHDIVQAALHGQLEEDDLDLIAKMAHVRLAWLRRGTEPQRPPQTAFPTGTVYVRPVLGTIAAGTPLLATNNRKGWAGAANPNVAFFFIVRGDSMAPKIIAGDLVGIALRDRDEIRNSDICALLLAKPDDDDSRYLTLKHIQHDPVTGATWATSINPDYLPIPLHEDSEETRALGVLVELQRKYDS